MQKTTTELIAEILAGLGPQSRITFHRPAPNVFGDALIIGFQTPWGFCDEALDLGAASQSSLDLGEITLRRLADIVAAHANKTVAYGPSMDSRDHGPRLP